MNKLSLVIKCPNLQVPLAENRDNFPLKLTFLPFFLPHLNLIYISGCVCREGIWGLLANALSAED